MQYFNIALEKLFKGLLDVDTLDVRCALAMDDGNDPGAEIDQTFLADFFSAAGFAPSEFDGAGYARKVLAGVADNRDDPTDLVNLIADDYTITGLAAGTNPVSGALIYAHVTTDADSWPIVWLPYTSNQTPDGSDFPVAFHADGWFALAQAAAATDVRFFNKCKEALVNGQIDFDSDDIRVLLTMDDGVNDCMTETDEDTLSAFFAAAGVTTVEFDGAGYARTALTGTSVSTEYGNDLVRILTDDLTLSSVSAGTYPINGALVYKHVTNDTDAVPILYRKFSPQQTPNGSDFNITWGTEKLLRLKKAA